MIFSYFNRNKKSLCLDLKSKQGREVVYRLMTKLLKIPVRIGSYDFGLRNNPPEIGEGSRQLLKRCGFSDDEVEGLKRKGG